MYPWCHTHGDPDRYTLERGYLGAEPSDSRSILKCPYMSTSVYHTEYRLTVSTQPETGKTSVKLTKRGDQDGKGLQCMGLLSLTCYIKFVYSTLTRIGPMESM